MSVETGIVKSLEYFTGLTDVEIEEIKTSMFEKKYNAYTTFLYEGDESDCLYFLVEGLVKVSMSSPDGREQILHFAVAHEALNVVSTFDGGNNQANMTAMTQIVLYAIQKKNLSIILKKHPQVNINIMKSLASRIRHESNLVAALSSGQVQNRLALLLMGEYAGESALVSANLTKEDMAGLIGTSREVIHRTLRVMEQSGAIKQQSRRIEIVNKNRLLEFTKNNSWS